MEVRRSIKTRIWSDPWVETLSPEQKLLWIYLLTNRDTNMLGIYEITTKRISYETGLTQQRIENSLKDFESIGKAFYWDGIVFLPNWIKNQAMNPNMLVSANKIYDSLSKELKTRLFKNGFESFESLSNGYQMLSKIEIEEEGEVEINPEIVFSYFYDYQIKIVRTLPTGDKDIEKLKTDYLNFVDYLFGKGKYLQKDILGKEINNRKKNLLKLDKQLTFDEFSKLVNRCGTIKETLMDIFDSMENWKPLSKNNSTIYKSAITFIDNAKERQSK
jgi:hypothetical protein